MLRLPRKPPTDIATWDMRGNLPGGIRSRLRRKSPADTAAVAGVASAAMAAQLEAGFAVPPDPTAGAFFDVDNTIMQGASLFHLARAFAARRFFTTRDIIRFAWQQVRFRVGGSENAGHMHSARDTALSFVAGHRVDELQKITEETFDEYMAPKIWPGTRALAQIHLDAGQRVWLVTAAPVEVAQVIARRLALTGALGTVAESLDGVYTGRLVGDILHGPAKAEAVKALAAREGLDLQRCSAYSDSSNDIPMLSLVGNPYAVNPDPELRRYAREHAWRIRDYRTGRKALRAGIPTAAALGALTGGIAVGVALRRRYER